MLDWLKTRSDRRQIARSIYGSIVTRAREPVFYARWGVPDSIQGRFEMVALHLVLALRRIAAEGPDAEPLGRALTEAFVVDLDVPWVLDRAELKSKCKNSPFDEARLQGRVLRTIVAGRTAYEFV